MSNAVQGPYTFKVLNGGFTDSARNVYNGGDKLLTFTYDNINPIWKNTSANITSGPLSDGKKYLNLSEISGNNLIIEVDLSDNLTTVFNGEFTESSYSLSPDVSGVLDVTNNLATITYDMSNAAQGDYTFTVINAGFTDEADNSGVAIDASLNFTYDVSRPTIVGDISANVVPYGGINYLNENTIDGKNLVITVDLFDNLTSDFDGLFKQSSYSISPHVSSTLDVTGTTATITYDMSNAVQGDYIFKVLDEEFTDSAGNPYDDGDVSLNFRYDISKPTVVGDISANVETHNGTKYLNIDSLATQGNKLEIKVELNDNFTSDFNGLFTESSYSLSPDVSSELDVTNKLATITYDMSNAAQGDYTFTVLNGGFTDSARNVYSNNGVVKQLQFIYDNINPIWKSTTANITSGPLNDGKKYLNISEISENNLIVQVDLSDNLTTSFDGEFTESSYSISPDVSGVLDVSNHLATITYNMSNAAQGEYVFTVLKEHFTDEASNEYVGNDMRLTFTYDVSRPTIVGGDISANVVTRYGIDYLNEKTIDGNNLVIAVDLSDNLISDFNGLFTQSSYSISPNVSSTLDVSGTKATITYDMSGEVQGNYTFTVEDEKFTDSAGNEYNGGDVSLNFIYDVTKPVFDSSSVDLVSDPSYANTINSHHEAPTSNPDMVTRGKVVLTSVFSEPLQEIDVTKISKNFANLDVTAELQSDKVTVKFVLDPNYVQRPNDTYDISLNAGFAIDLAGNESEAVPDLYKYTYDITKPVVEITSPNIQNGGEINYNVIAFDIALSEISDPTPTDNIIEVSDVICSGCQLYELTNTTTTQYTFWVRVFEEGACSVRIPQGSIIDNNGNKNDEVVFNFTHDVTAPVLSIASSPYLLKIGQSYNALYDVSYNSNELIHFSTTGSVEGGASI